MYPDRSHVPMARTGFHDVQHNWTRHKEAPLQEHRDILIGLWRRDEEFSTQVQQKFFKAFQLWLLRDGFAETAIEEYFTLWCHSGGKHSTLWGRVALHPHYTHLSITFMRAESK